MWRFGVDGAFHQLRGETRHFTKCHTPMLAEKPFALGYVYGERERRSANTAVVDCPHKLGSVRLCVRSSAAPARSNSRLVRLACFQSRRVGLGHGSILVGNLDRGGSLPPRLYSQAMFPVYPSMGKRNPTAIGGDRTVRIWRFHSCGERGPYPRHFESAHNRPVFRRPIHSARTADATFPRFPIGKNGGSTGTRLMETISADRQDGNASRRDWPLVVRFGQHTCDSGWRSYEGGDARRETPRGFRCAT